MNMVYPNKSTLEHLIDNKNESFHKEFHNPENDYKNFHN